MATRLELTPGQSASLICRLCFTERQHHELVFIGTQLQKWIERLTSVKIVHAPDAPASVCMDCRTTLEEYESFRVMCRNNDEIFQETYLRNNASEPKKRKVTAVNEAGACNVVAKKVRPVTMEVELGVEPCECSTSDELATEVKIEEVVVEKSEPDPLNVKVVTEHDLSRDVVIEILNANSACQALVRQKLVHGYSVTSKDKSLICRTLCMQLFFPMVVQGIPVSMEAKQKLAECIIEAYSCLATDVNGLPPESEWFWKNSGQSKGEHSGKIQVWYRNAQNKAPESVRRKRRGGQPTDEEANAIEELCQYDEEPVDQADYRKVSQLLVATFGYRQNLRGPKMGPSQLCAEFPHLLRYGTLMIEEEFDRMYPNRDAIGTLSSISSLCLMLNHPYNEVACGTIQALLKVMAELTLQGNVRKETSSGLPPLEEYASVFVRWQQPDTDLDYFVENVPGDPPYIVCSTMAFAEGQYFLIIMNTAIDCGSAFERAFDVLLKSYKVFNFPVPGRAKKVMEFFDLVYGIQKFSRLSNVNKLFDKIKQAADRLPN